MSLNIVTYFILRNCLKSSQDPPELINRQIETWDKQEQKKGSRLNLQ